MKNINHICSGFFLIFVMTFLIGYNEVITTLKKAKYEWIIFNFIIESGITLVWTAMCKMILDVVDTAPKFSTLFMMRLASLLEFLFPFYPYFQELGA